MSGQPPPWRTWLVQGAKLAVVVAALTWLLRSGRLDLTDLCFDRQGLPWVAAGALLTLGPFFLSFYRLYWMLRATDCSLPLGSVVRIGFIGSFFNTFTLGSVGGDVVKLGYLANASGRPAAAFASVLLDRAISLLALLTLGVLALLVGSGHLVGSVGVQGLMLVTLLLLGGAAFCGVVGIVAMARGRRVGLAVWGVITLGLVLAMATMGPARPWALFAPAPAGALQYGRLLAVVGVDTLGALMAAILLPACLPGGRLGDMVRDRLPLGEPFMRFVDALLTVRHRLPLMAALWLLSMTSQAMTVVAIYLLAHPLPLEIQPSLLQMATVVPLTLIINAVPVPGGGLGVGEAAMATLLELWTVDGQAVTGGAVIFLSWRVWIVCWGLLGLPAILTKRRSGPAADSS